MSPHAEASSLSKFTRCAGLAGGLGRFLGMIHCGCAVGHGCAGAEETLKTEVGVPCFGGCGVGTARSFSNFCDFYASAEKDPLTHVNEGLQWCAVGRGCAGAEETLKTEVGVPCFGGCGVGAARSFSNFCDFDASAEKDPLTHINEGLQFRDMYSLPRTAFEPRPTEAHRFREFRHTSVSV
jgi:hypothetical protein